MGEFPGRGTRQKEELPAGKTGGEADGTGGRKKGRMLERRTGSVPRAGKGHVGKKIEVWWN